MSRRGRSRRNAATKKDLRLMEVDRDQHSRLSDGSQGDEDCGKPRNSTARDTRVKGCLGRW